MQLLTTSQHHVPVWTLPRNYMNTRAHIHTRTRTSSCFISFHECCSCSWCNFQRWVRHLQHHQVIVIHLPSFVNRTCWLCGSWSTVVCINRRWIHKAKSVHICKSWTTSPARKWFSKDRVQWGRYSSTGCQVSYNSVWTTKANNQSVMLTDVMSILDIMSRGGGWSIHKPICMCFNAVKHVTIPATT